MLKISLVFIFLFSYGFAAESKLSDGRDIVCNREAYNCPSYNGKYQHKRLKNCKDVQRVWKFCDGDPHGLDRDHDKLPCEKDC